MNVLEKELHETRTGAQQAAQLKTTELEASSQVSKDVQEQLSRLATEKAAMEQRLQWSKGCNGAKAASQDCRGCQPA